MNELVEVKNILYNEKLHSREGISKFAEYIDSLPESLGEDPFPLYHTFADGVYSREIHLPKDYFLVGKIHRHESMVYMLKGSVIVVDENGTKELTAPLSFVSKPGIQRVGYVTEDVVWIDIHSVESDNVEDAEEEIFVESYDEYDEYVKTINEIGFSENEVRLISENESDMISVVNDNFEIKDSDIEGKGVFAKKEIKEGFDVGTARLGTKRTQIGRYANHSKNENAKPVVDGIRVIFVATRDIAKGEEVTVNYKETKKAAQQLDEKILNNGDLKCQE